MRALIYISILLILSTISPDSFGQDKVTVRGQVYGVNKTTDLLTLFVVSQTNRTGNFGNPNGTFEITVERSDTILIGSIGYFTAKICVADSAKKDTYQVDVYLQQLSYYLKEITVLAPRDMRRIYDDIERLGYNPKSDRLSGFVDPIASPITFLYQMYSRHARQERLAKELINAAKRRDLLKELLAKYVNSGIIDLTPEQFDDFIEYIHVSDEFLKNTSQYDFIIYVKRKYELYQRQHKYDGWEQDE